MKLRIIDRREFLRKLARLKAKLTHARVHERNTLYDTAEGQLAQRGQMLRLRMESAASGARRAERSGEFLKHKPPDSAVLTFKGPVARAKASKRGRYKVRREHELRIHDYEEMPKILEALGLRPSFRYEKFRSTFTLPGMKQLKLTLDETPIGLFAELEGGRREIDRAAAMLGFGRSDYIDKSYGELLREAKGPVRRKALRGSSPFAGLGDMLFSS